MTSLLRRCLLPLAVLMCALPAWAWNGAGHRLVAAIAWRQMTPAAQEKAADLLARHPDYEQWTVKSGDSPAYAAFLGAATWADEIRHDRRFYDEAREAPTPPFPGMPDTARHKSWHFVDIDAAGEVRDGEIDRQIGRLGKQLAQPFTRRSDKAVALVWLIHLVADIHQPLHVGSRDDAGGNDFAIEDPFNPRRPFTNLHAWWDDLPGPPWLRGPRLEEIAELLIADFPPPAPGGVGLWLRESLEISRGLAYPEAAGSLLPTVDDAFLAQSRAIANRRLVAAGYRLGWLLNEALSARASRGTTPAPRRGVSPP